MAPRKNAPEPFDLGLDAEDVQLPRLRVVGKLSKLIDSGVASPGNIAIGADAEDTESSVYDTMNAKSALRVYVLNIDKNYSCSFKDKEANPDLEGQWQAGDPDMPPEAKAQYNYTMYVPQHSEILPVLYTASSTAAREGRKVNSKLQTEALGGTAPYELCFEMSTKTYTGGKFSWPGPVFALGEPVAAEVAKAKDMYEMLYGPARKAIAADSSDGDKPSL